MNALLLVVGVALTAAAFGLLAHALALPRLRAARRLSEIGAYGYPSGEAEVADERSEPLTEGLARLAERLGAAAMPRFGERREELRGALVAAGMYGVGVDSFLGYRLLSAVALPLAWLWLGTSTDASAALVVIGVPVAGLLGWRVPMLVVRERGGRRLAEVDSELPELIDSLVVTVEAGSGFNSALQMAARELHGPLGEEIGLTLREQRMGLSSEAALESLARRVDTPAMRAFVRAVVQAERLGVSIGDIMRGLAVEARARRRSAAEERAHKAPVKMLFPLVLLIFPSIMIVLLYPSLHNLSQTLGGG